MFLQCKCSLDMLEENVINLSKNKNNFSPDRSRNYYFFQHMCTLLKLYKTIFKYIELLQVIFKPATTVEHCLRKYSKYFHSLMGMGRQNSVIEENHLNDTTA